MEHKKLSELTDQELLAKAKEVKSSAIFHAFIIGFLIGIIIFSVVVNSVGIFTLIPLYFVYKLFKNPKKDDALEQELKTRNLK